MIVIHGKEDHSMITEFRELTRNMMSQHPGKVQRLRRRFAHGPRELQEAICALVRGLAARQNVQLRPSGTGFRVYATTGCECDDCNGFFGMSPDGRLIASCRTGDSRPRSVFTEVLSTVPSALYGICKGTPEEVAQVAGTLSGGLDKPSPRARTAWPR